MRPLALFACVLSAAGQNAPKRPALKILLVEGQGAINVVDKKAERRLTIRVEEKYGVPGKGIPVTFTLPDSGPSGSFNKKRARSVTVNTDNDGYAVVHGYRPNKIAGQYNIRVSASTPGGPISASIPQTNAGGAYRDREPWPKKMIGSVVMAAAASGGAIKGLVGK
jgi:hypothetical protein